MLFSWSSLSDLIPQTPAPQWISQPSPTTRYPHGASVIAFVPTVPWPGMPSPQPFYSGKHLLIPSLRQMPPPLGQWPRPGVWWAVAFSLTLQHYYPFMAPVILHRDRVCLSAPSVVLGMTPFQAIAELPPPLPSASSIALGSQGCSEWRGAGVGEDCEWSVFRTDCTPRAWTPRQALVDCPELPWLYWLHSYGSARTFLATAGKLMRNWYGNISVL